MQVILSHFMSLDGVVQAPGGPKEDTDGGFAHGGWSMKYFDPESMGPVIDSALQLLLEPSLQEGALGAAAGEFERP